MDTFHVSRREFLQASGGLFLVAGVGNVFAADDPKYGVDGMPHGWVDNPLVFVAIAPDGMVTITCHRAEMGQGVRTGVPLIIAEELEADWSKVRVVQAPGDELKYGNQDTDGSRTTRQWPRAAAPLRRRGAPDAGGRGGCAPGRARLRGEGGQPRGDPHEREDAGLRRARRGRREAAGAEDRGGAAPQGPEAVPLHRQGQHAHRRRIRHHHGPREVRAGRGDARHALRAVVARSPVYGGTRSPRSTQPRRSRSPAS